MPIRSAADGGRVDPAPGAVAAGAAPGDGVRDGIVQLTAADAADFGVNPTRQGSFHPAAFVFGGGFFLG